MFGNGFMSFSLVENLIISLDPNHLEGDALQQMPSHHFLG